MINEDNVIINTPEKELETEPQNIPQGENPFINPNPGYGEDGETKPAIKTEPVSGERGIRSEIVTPLKEGIKTEQLLVNFLKGIKIKGKPLEEYIDSQGGVTEEELVAALANYYKKSETYSKQEIVANPSDNDGADLDGLQIGSTKYKAYPKVVANPTLAGTESALTGLRVGNTKYKVNKLEDIKDSAGNPRFIEGNLSGASAKLNISYAKWSLSGTHLMLVVAGKLPAGESLTAYQDRFFSVDVSVLPQWIMDKIYPTVGDDVIFNIGIDLYKDYHTKDTFNNILTLAYREGGTIKNAIYLQLEENIASYTSDRYFRVCVDLLIDSDYSE